MLKLSNVFKPVGSLQDLACKAVEEKLKKIAEKEELQKGK